MFCNSNIQLISISVVAALFRETVTALKVVVIAVGVLQHLDPGKISFKF